MNSFGWARHSEVLLFYSLCEQDEEMVVPIRFKMDNLIGLSKWF